MVGAFRGEIDCGWGGALACGWGRVIACGWGGTAGFPWKKKTSVFVVCCGFFERLVVVSLPRFRVADFFRLLDRFIFLFAGGNERIGHVAAADCS